MPWSPVEKHMPTPTSVVDVHCIPQLHLNAVLMPAKDAGFYSRNINPWKYSCSLNGLVPDIPCGREEFLVPRDFKILCTMLTQFKYLTGRVLSTNTCRICDAPAPAFGDRIPFPMLFTPTAVLASFLSLLIHTERTSRTMTGTELYRTELHLDVLPFLRYGQAFWFLRSHLRSHQKSTPRPRLLRWTFGETCYHWEAQSNTKRMQLIEIK